MSQVATESQSSSSPQPTDIMTQRVHNKIDSSGIGNAESALPLKSIGLSSSSHNDPCPMELRRPRQQLSQDRVRRSRRLVERSAKIKNETADTTSQRLAPRPIKQEPPHSSSQPSSQVASTSSAPGPLPDPSRLPTNELPSPSSATPSTTTHNSTIVTAPSSPSHVNTAPESSALTRPGLTNWSSTRENNFHDAVSTRTPTSIQGSPGQHENSTYALTFASTAEEIPFRMRSSLETTPTAPPTSRTHNREASSNSAHFPRSNEATPIAPPISSGTSTTLNTQMLGSIPTSVIQNSLARGIARERNSANVHATATSRTGLPSSHILLPTNFDDSTHIIENGASMHRSVPPLVCGMSAPTGHAQNHRPDGMLASTGHAQNHRPAGMLASTGHAQNHRPDGMSAGHAQNHRSDGMSAHTGHAQNDNRAGGINNETVSSNSASSTTTSSSSSNPLAALFEVPLPLSLPMGTDLHIPRTNPTNVSLREERQRIEQSTAFIASHAQDRATTSSRRTSNTSSSSSHNRRRWRRRENEEMASQSIEGEGVHVRERSSARQRRQQRVRDRDRSPVATTTTSQHDMTSSSATSSLLPRATSTRRRRHQRGGGGGAHSSRSGSSGPPPPLPGASETSISAIPPPPSALLHVPISSTASTASTVAGRNGAASDYRTQQHTCIGYQVVPQGQTSSVAAGSSNSGALGRPPLPHIHLSQGQGGMPVASNFHNPRRSSSSFHSPSSAAGGSSSAAESVVQVPMPQGAVHVPAPLSLPESHSGTILYPLSTSHSVPSMSHSHFPFHPPSSRHGMGASASIAEPVVIAADHEVPRFLREIDMVSSRNSGVSSRNSGGRSGSGAEGGGGGGERRESLVEVIVVDSSDSEHEDDDDVIVSGVSRVPSFPGHLPWTVNRHQISSDEAFARRLQEEFDQEAHDVFAHVPPSISSRPQMFPPPPVPAGPSIPPPRHQPHNHHTHTADSGSLIRNNYEALVSHVERLTHHDAMTLLRITQSDAQRRTGRTPRTQGEYRRAMENMGEVLIVRAIMGSTGIPPTTYEDLLELAETLGPARPQGLPQEVINNFPVRNFKRSLDTTTSGELPKCVVCMCEFEERERLRTLPCVHEFHKDCIDQWLKDHRTCPICRVELHSQQ